MIKDLIKSIKKRFTKVIIIEKTVVRVERIPKIQERTVILYTNDPQYKNENVNERLN